MRYYLYDLIIYLKIDKGYNIPQVHIDFFPKHNQRLLLYSLLEVLLPLNSFHIVNCVMYLRT